MKDKELWIKNQDKTIANYTKLFIKKKNKSFIILNKDAKDFTTNSFLKYKFFEKKHRPNEC